VTKGSGTQPLVTKGFGTHTSINRRPAGNAVSRAYLRGSSVGIDRVGKPATMLQYSKEVSLHRTLTTNFP